MSAFDSAVSVYTRGRDPVSLLRYEATRKPDLAYLCECAADLSDAEIDSAPYLPWIRGALKQLRGIARELRARGSNQPALSASLSDLIVDGHTPDPKGVLFEYTGDDIFVKSYGSELQIPYGKLFFLDENHQVWVESSKVASDRRLFDRSVRRGDTTKQGYAVAIQERLQRLHPNAPQTVCLGASTDSAGPGRGQPLAHLGVRIGR